VLQAAVDARRKVYVLNSKTYTRYLWVVCLIVSIPVIEKYKKRHFRNLPGDLLSILLHAECDNYLLATFKKKR
jgi:hypothetical protein